MASMSRSSGSHARISSHRWIPSSGRAIPSTGATIRAMAALGERGPVPGPFGVEGGTLGRCLDVRGVAPHQADLG